jgi:hypothetical protein
MARRKKGSVVIPGDGGLDIDQKIKEFLAKHPLFKDEQVSVRVSFEGLFELTCHVFIDGNIPEHSAEIVAAMYIPINVKPSLTLNGKKVDMSAHCVVS